MSLKNFIQVALAVVLTLVVVSVAALWVLVAGSWAGRGGDVPQVLAGEQANPDKKAERSLVFCLPTVEPQTGTQFVGVAVINSAQPREEKVLGSGSSYTRRFSPECSIGEKWGPTRSIQNVIVVPSDSSKQHLLFDRPVLIRRLVLPNRAGVEGHSLAPSDHLYWEFREEDTNGDGVIDTNDALGAYVTSLDGRSLERVSPHSSHLVAIQRDEAPDVFTMQVQYDSDGDGTFGPADSVEIVRYPISGRESTPLLDPAVVEEARELLE